VRIDESGRHDPVARIDDARCTIRDGEVADGEDAVPEDADIGGPTRGAGPIDDGATPDKQVEGGHRSMMTSAATTGPRP
jgi:hypothetical protein